jgi:hypothetical protein
VSSPRLHRPIHQRQCHAVPCAAPSPLAPGAASSSPVHSAPRSLGSPRSTAPRRGAARGPCRVPPSACFLDQKNGDRIERRSAFASSPAGATNAIGVRYDAPPVCQTSSRRPPRGLACHARLVLGWLLRRWLRLQHRGWQRDDPQLPARGHRRPRLESGQRSARHRARGTELPGFRGHAPRQRDGSRDHAAALGWLAARAVAVPERGHDGLHPPRCRAFSDFGPGNFFASPSEIHNFARCSILGVCRRAKESTPTRSICHRRVW